MDTCRFVLFTAMAAACSGEPGAPLGSASRGPVVDQAFPPTGVPDRGDDPAVVALDVGGYASCSGALIAPDVVLTAGRCLIRAPPEIRCPPEAPVTLLPAPPPIRILVSDAGGTVHERASARGILVASGTANCLGDTAFVLLDTPIDEIAPLVVRPTGAAKGDRVRAIDFDSAGAAERVRDHLPVLDTSDTQLVIGELCGNSQGGPALDESTAQIVGVAVPPGARACSGAEPSVIYARTDVVLAPVGEALSESYVGQLSTRGTLKTKKGPTDMGANCAHGADCAAGVCVEEPGQAYCSRTCGPHDRCPTHFNCQQSVDALWVCVEH
jgi:hypothetical protein